MRRVILLSVALATACAPEPAEEAARDDGVCDALTLWAELPDEVQETSGVAASREFPGVFWTHNDSEGDSALFPLDSTGALLGRVRVRGATNRDWEDLAVAPCSPGSADDCVFIGDIGDNSERRQNVSIYRIREPDPRSDSVSRPADRFEARYPDGPRDAEALFVSDAGIHIVTKGRTRSVELYRMSPPYRSGESRDLVRVQEIAPPPTSVSAQVTAAAASADGRIVVIRTYSGLHFFDGHADTLRRLGPVSDFLDVAQPLGEGVDFIAANRLVLTGEAGGRAPATIATVRCDPRSGAPDSADSGP